ncbi:hypothetical protein V9T40_014899 [Parthenolecanium corni]|uniref:CHK kinase-like domain-containing protein n=1 Tax=Parthenolecanium corni TaxID=536013 RepID=A0AAN9TMA2_9HEMI
MNFNSDDKHVKNILKSCFQNADKIRILESNEKNDEIHFTSSIIQLKVECYQNGKPQYKDLILKIPNSDRSNSYFSRFDFYHKEIRTYAEMIPRMIHRLGNRIFPTHYCTTSSESLVFENLSSQGYKSGAKEDFFDLEHNYLILKALAQFHAASYRIRQENPDILNEAAFHKTISIDARQDSIDTWYPVMCKLLRQREATHLIPEIEKAFSFLRQDDDRVYSTVKSSHFKLVVFNHGDFRKENLQLKHDSLGGIENVKFIDFQACWWSSPVYDFLVHLIFSVPIEIVEKHFEKLVDEYLANLKKALKGLKCFCDYERADFMKDVSRLHFVIISCLLAKCIFSSNISHAKKVDTLVLEDKEKMHPYEECLQDEAFAQSLFGWLKFCEKLGVFETFEKWTNNSVS